MINYQISGRIRNCNNCSVSFVNLLGLTAYEQYFDPNEKEHLFL